MIFYMQYLFLMSAFSPVPPTASRVPGLAGVGLRGRPRKWPGGAVLLSVYLPPDLKEEIERRAEAKHMSLSEYSLSLMLLGLDIERAKEAEKSVEAKEVP